MSLAGARHQRWHDTTLDANNHNHNRNYNYNNNTQHVV